VPCSRASIPTQVCIRVRFASEPIFSKCKFSIPTISPLSAKIREGQDAIYQSKLAWGHLLWISLPIPVLLRHEREGPSFEVSCRQFEPTFLEQTRLYYKQGSGWTWILSTPFALLAHEVDLDSYVTKYTTFYLNKTINNKSWLTPVFLAAWRNTNVSALLLIFSGLS
jgi:hypothetical protein